MKWQISKIKNEHIPMQEQHADIMPRLQFMHPRQINDVIRSRHGASRQIGVEGQGIRQDDENERSYGSCSMQNLNWCW